MPVVFSEQCRENLHESFMSPLHLPHVGTQNADVMVGTLSNILNHMNKGHTLGAVEQKQENGLKFGKICSTAKATLDCLLPPAFRKENKMCIHC